MKIYINEQFSEFLNHSIVRDLYNEVMFANPPESSSKYRGVRGAVIRKNIAGLSLVLRLYRRGGLARHFLSKSFIRNPFLGSSQYRPLKEFFILKRLSPPSASFPVPTPVAVAVKVNKFTYSGMLITLEIPQAKTLLEQTPKKKELVKNCVTRAGELTREIIENGVYHTDLHLGNVMYQEDGSVYLIDFDGAKIISTDAQKRSARKKIASRWCRSIRKWLGDDEGIIKNFEEPFLAALCK